MGADAQDLKPNEEKKFVAKGRQSYRKGEYWKSKSYYDKVTQANSQNPLYWFEAGLVYFDSEVKREEALVYFEKSLELYGTSDEIIPELYYYAGRAYHFVGNFEKAIELFNTFLTKVKNNKKADDIKQDVARHIEYCNNGIPLRNVHAYEVDRLVNLGRKVNSEYPDFTPVIDMDETILLFCSRRPPDNKQGTDGLYYEDIFYTVKMIDGEWGEAQIIDKSSGYLKKEINEGKAHEAPISLSADGNTLYIYKENSIWKSTKDTEGKWGAPVRMNQNINIGTANPSIYVTPDEQEMFVVSIGVKDGFGGRDIYITKRNEMGGWEKPVNLGPTINTPYDDDAPYLSKDGKTLYFASQGHNSMGGFDIFRTRRDENGNWSAPENIGTPINSAGNDIFYVENNEGTLAYYASMRPGSFGFLDLYTATYDCRNIPATTIKGYAIYAENNLPINGVIKITDKTTGTEMGTFPIDPKTGRYTMNLPPEKTYLLEMMIASNKYNTIRPHTEEFTIPEQCVVYNLFQQIRVDYLKDGSGAEYAQRAHFKNALFDIDTEIKNTFNAEGLSESEPTSDTVKGISGVLRHNDALLAKNVEVALLNQYSQVLRITSTDDQGRFAFEKIDLPANYILLINEDDAKASEGTAMDATISGTINSFANGVLKPRPNQQIYLANGARKIVNIKASDAKGNFKITSTPENADAVAEVNDNATISYNLDLRNSEVVYSAYIINIDPDNTQLAYTEYIDIIELKDLVVDGSNGSGLDKYENLLFDFDKHFLRQRSVDILATLKSFMEKNPTVTIRLDGHTDWIGTDVYNDGLSKSRSLSAHKYLIDHGIAPNRIVNKWFGEGTPVAANEKTPGVDDPDGRQLNRRVEIKMEIPELSDIYISL